MESDTEVPMKIIIVKIPVSSGKKQLTSYPRGPCNSIDSDISDTVSLPTFDTDSTDTMSEPGCDDLGYHSNADVKDIDTDVKETSTSAGDDVDIEIAQRNAEATRDVSAGAFRRRPMTSDSSMSRACEIKARANTPANMSVGRMQSAQFYTGDGREAGGKVSVYQEALNLITERSMSPMRQRSSTGHLRLGQKDGTSYPHQSPSYFYVQQQKPSPMAPLKAWRGYNGNVYFEPIKVTPAHVSDVPDEPESSLNQNSVPDPNTRSPSSKSLPATLPDHPPQTIQEEPAQQQQQQQQQQDPDQQPQQLDPDQQPHEPRTVTAVSRASAKSTKSGYSYKGNRQMVLLDRQAVFNQENDKIHEDIMWLVGQQSTGSLRLDATRTGAVAGMMTSPRSPSSPRRQQTQILPNKNRPSDRDKICRGSVAHKIYAMRNKGLPLLAVSGDNKYVRQQAPPSALLRTQTQYSQSNQRALNTPELYDKLPPLEQVRASLRQMDNAREGSPNTHTIPAADRLRLESSHSKTKPMIKYSAELRDSTQGGRVDRRAYNKYQRYQTVS